MFVYDGKHLLVDAQCRNHEALVDLTTGQACLERICRAIDMTMILPPVGVRFPHAVGEMHRVVESLEREGLGDSTTALNLREQLNAREQLHYGYSTFVMIAESHLSLHTFPESGFLTFDCYSCTGFDHDTAVSVLNACFDLTENQKVQVIARPGPQLDTPS
jgi:S-adenosylmethionine/arginine decarboxylase-like enzyme